MQEVEELVLLLALLFFGLFLEELQDQEAQGTWLLLEELEGMELAA
jgi:hypothetical protein